MVNKAECNDNALQQVRNHRHIAIEKADELRDRLLATHFELQQIESELIALSKKQMLARIRKDPVLEQIVTEYDALRLKKSFQLQKLGYSDDVFSPVFRCRVCDDNGVVDGRFCNCVKRLAHQKMLEQLCKDMPVESFSFESFSLDFYQGDDRVKMEKNFTDCQSYVKDFSLASDSIYMLGGTGLGKTHLAFAMAKEIVKKGFSVVYSPAPTLISELEKEHFGQTAEKVSDFYKSADLLIIDDLGTEYLSPVAKSSLHHVVDHRLLMKLPTIINSNLLPSELLKQYGERLASRIGACYRTMHFVGKDIRIQKRLASKKV